MKKFLQLFSLVMGLFIFNACTEPNPAELYGWPDPNDIDGPRVLREVVNNGTTEEKFELNDGKLSKIIRNKSANDGVESQTIELSYMGGRISKIEISGNIPGSNETGMYQMVPNYDNTNGRLISLMRDLYVGNIHTQHSITTFIYDGNGSYVGTLTRTADVNPASPTTYSYTKMRKDNVEFSGANMTKLESIDEVVNPTTGDVLSSVTNKYEYSSFDWRINPYTTINDGYLMMIASVFPEMYYNMSDNNAEKVKYKLGSEAEVEKTFKYKYDTHNYITSNGTKSYFYQNQP